MLHSDTLSQKTKHKTEQIQTRERSSVSRLYLATPLYPLPFTSSSRLILFLGTGSHIAQAVQTQCSRMTLNCFCTLQGSRARALTLRSCLQHSDLCSSGVIAPVYPVTPSILDGQQTLSNIGTGSLAQGARTKPLGSAVTGPSVEQGSLCCAGASVVMWALMMPPSFLCGEVIVCLQSYTPNPRRKEF